MVSALENPARRATPQALDAGSPATILDEDITRLAVELPSLRERLNLASSSLPGLQSPHGRRAR